jgi:hypothetical protein
MSLNNSDVRLDTQVSITILLQTHNEYIRMVNVTFLFTTSETFSQYGDKRPVAEQREFPRVSCWLRAAM